MKKDYSEALAEKVWSFVERFAGYGFNKAHATSYAMIAYQTAYLKAHYPVEYMTALMSAEAGRDDKMALSLEECRLMNIKVLSPDINHSVADFTVEPDKSSLDQRAIRFGFQAVKNVGTAAIDNVLLERTGAGEFKSFTDFVARVDNQKVNKKVLESLIKVGAFDKYGKRSVMLDEIERVRAKVGKSGAEKNSAQGGLFDTLLKDEAVSIVDDWKSDKAEFTSRELMEMERELLGIYLREHPAVRTLKKSRNEWCTTIAEIDEKKGQKATVIAIIKSVKVVMTKAKNQEMAFLGLSDETGDIEAVVFPKTFAGCKDLLIANQVISIKAKVEEREDRLSLLVESVDVVRDKGEETEKEERGNVVHVPAGTNKATLLELNKLLQENKGSDEVILVFENSHGSRELKLPFGVAYTEKLKAAIATILRIEKISE